MDQTTRNLLQRATQDARKLLETEFAAQLEGIFDILPDGTILPEAGVHLDERQRLIRRKIVRTIEHTRLKEAGKSTARAVDDYLREAAFTFLNRFAALKMLEARGLVQPCVTKGDQSSGFKEFTGLAPGLGCLPDKGYQLYLECLFDELGTEVKVLFDRHDPASLLWPRRPALFELLDILNRDTLQSVWAEDETIGWIYQYFNSQEERRAMRDASAAPRNSRELAVRNQFFTPRYVVEFLTDNTLGRIWYEMRQGETTLKDQCRYLVQRPEEIFLGHDESPPKVPEQTEGTSQKEMLNQLVYVPFRAKKDPRDLKIIDPACGSGHFLLYCLELLITIYMEAWADPIGPISDITGNKLVDDYPSLELLKLAIPVLILKHNLHGIDIDPRCAQIAALALWMRAQRAFNDFGIGHRDRVAVEKTNIVVAESMPGERKLLDEFISTELSISPEDALVGQLVRHVFEAMKLAGEAGTLLKIEEEISRGIAEAKSHWQFPPKLVQSSLFEDLSSSTRQETFRFDVRGISDAEFWNEVESRIYVALARYAERAELGDYQRRLFAEDAARGFAFIDHCRQRYDVALMNPPFGDASLPSKPYLDDTYGDTKGDVYKAFVECFQARLVPTGYLGIISSRTGFFLGQGEDWRTRVVLRLFRPHVMVDLGSGVLDAMVETAAYVLRTLSCDEQSALVASLANKLSEIPLDKTGWFSRSKYQITRGLRRYQAEQELTWLTDHRFLIRDEKSPKWKPSFNSPLPSQGQNAGPGAVFTVMRLLEGGNEAKESALREVMENAKDVRRFTVNPESFALVPGGPFAYWVSDKVRTIFQTFPRIEGDVATVKVGDHPGDYDRYLRLYWESQNSSRDWIPFQRGGSLSPYYHDTLLVVDWDRHRDTFRGFIGRPGRPSLNPSNYKHYFLEGLSWPLRASRFAPYAWQKGGIFSARGPALLVKRDLLLPVLGICSSFIFDYLLKSMLGRSGFPEFQCGVIQNAPLPNFPVEAKNRLGELALECVDVKRRVDTGNETSHVFQLPPLLFENPADFQGVSSSLSIWTLQIEEHAAYIVARNQAEIDAISAQLYGINLPRIDEETAADDKVDGETAEVEVDMREAVCSLISYALGCAFGRFDSRYASREKPFDPLPDPFAPLSVCSPGVKSGPGGLPDYGGSPAIMTDDAGHFSDIECQIEAILAHLFVDKVEHLNQEMFEILGVKALRDFFHKPALFFADHLKRYSKNGRQAPIYWPLSSSGGSYTIWLYYHRFGRDTLFQALNDLAKPKLRHERSKLDRLRGEAGAQPTQTQREAIETQEVFVADLEGFYEDLARVAPLWNPDLNDGVIINFAPLWRMIGHSAWRKSVKECWDSLCSGDYDWAHLAMHLWPERVVPKCSVDASLAIAHGLDEIFWEKDDRDRLVKKGSPDGGWDLVIEGLVAARTSPAVKAALESLMGAPPLVGAGGGRRGSGRVAAPRRISRDNSQPNNEGAPTLTRIRSANSSPDSEAIVLIKEAIGTASGGTSKTEILAATGLTDSRWNASINTLLEQGLVIRSGERRGTRYHLAQGTGHDAAQSSDDNTIESQI